MGSYSQLYIDIKEKACLICHYVVYYNKIINNNPVAQLVEQHPFKVMVVGSIPTRITNLNQIGGNRIWIGRIESYGYCMESS